VSGAVGALLALVAVFAGVEPVQAPPSPPLIRIEIPGGADPGTTKIVLMGPTKDKPVRARPKGGAVAAIFSSDDYPPEALRKGETGLTVVETSIDAKGAVIGCKVVESSGSSALDAATCKIIRDRAQYIPAQDRKGRPVADTSVVRIRWVLPTIQFKSFGDVMEFTVKDGQVTTRCVAAEGERCTVDDPIDPSFIAMVSQMPNGFRMIFLAAFDPEGSTRKRAPIDPSDFSDESFADVKIDVDGRISDCVQRQAVGDGSGDLCFGLRQNRFDPVPAGSAIRRGTWHMIMRLYPPTPNDPKIAELRAVR
jgi:TonB family protein